MIEKEIRFSINEEIKKRIIEKSNPVKNITSTEDIVVGKDSFNSLNKYGYIIRIRTKNGVSVLELKERLDDSSFKETKVNIDNSINTIKILKTLGYEPYLYINRLREERKYGNLKLFIDDIELLGSYIEIEYQHSNEEELNNFLKELEIKSKSQPLYGDIFKNKIENDKNFSKKFNNRLNELIK